MVSNLSRIEADEKARIWVDREAFKEELLQIMEKKVHWAWSAFTSGQVAKERLHIHFEQEYETYVRDFPVLIGRAYVNCPIAGARRELAENLYEEETGGLVAGKPHPELFLEYPKGLGMDLSRFASVKLLPGAARYRNVLDRLTLSSGWEVACAVSTVFIEGTSHERGELEPDVPKRPTPPLEEHPLVKHYGLSLEHLALTKAHRQVEGEHRQSAWQVVLNDIERERRAAVVEGMREALFAWQNYRDDVAQACGIIRTSNE